MREVKLIRCLVFGVFLSCFAMAVTDQDRGQRNNQVTRNTRENLQQGCGCEGLEGKIEALEKSVETLKELTKSLQKPTLSTSCSDAMKILPAPRSTKQVIYPHGNNNNRSLEVLCDFADDGGGWTIIQKRSSGPRNDFNRTWNEYAAGFGSLDKNFWLGLDNIHALTKNGDQELRIELEDFEGNKSYAKYSNFSVAGSRDSYRLTLHEYSGAAGDSTVYLPSKRGHPRWGPDWKLTGMKFTTWDNDNDNKADRNCARLFEGGWWFNGCGAEANLNGNWYNQSETLRGWDGIHWSIWRDRKSLVKTEMKIRKRRYL